MEYTYIGAYWGARAETPRACAERLSCWLETLGGVNRALSTWYLKGGSRKAARVPIGMGVDQLAEAMLRSVNRRDDDGTPMEELGYSFDAWNRSDPAVGIAVTVGARGLDGSANSVILEFPPPAGSALGLYDPGGAEAIMESVVNAWEPEWAAWLSPTIRDCQSGGKRFVGWLTYFSEPCEARLEQVASRPLRQGTLMRLMEGWPTLETGTVLRFRRELAKCGCLS